MDKASMVRPLIAMGIKWKIQRRTAKEIIMTRRARKHPMTLEVNVMFEPNREEHQVLHHAYTFLLPMARRRLVPPSNSVIPASADENQVGERKHS
jgi:hypothetical protein